MYKNKYKMIMLIWIKNNYVRTVCINLTEHFKQSSAQHMYYNTSHIKAPDTTVFQCKVEWSSFCRA